ncbi:MAG: C/D box methylation guide ribonucleoprotein complex aNOP56 subunit [Desulfurococcaceae archaeon]|jgi:nucleolar protein 56|nr:C/D box methylation guide ribonucleoprotein complex aNOP56 subunit [Desulfurococcaceae archaeon]MCC6053355.1 C/D box methylation guide ribonucleoprotein complex aNOP56 subunit [Desulfurococcaceae archaeon]
MQGRVYVAETIIGVIAVDENGDIVEYVKSPSGLDDLVEYVISVEKGDVTPQLVEILGKLKERGISEVVVESYSTAKAASSQGLTSIVDPSSIQILRIREKLPELAVKLGFASAPEEYFKKLHEVALEWTRRKLRRVAQKRDLLAVQAVRAIDDIDKTINLYVARLREWYSLHFPELDELLKDHLQYAKLVYELGDRANFTAENLAKLDVPEDLIEKITSAATTTIGAELSDFDLNYIRVLAGIILDLYKLRTTLEEYIETIMKEVSPNITALVGAKLGARLLSLAGGLEKMAKLPASTIQVLGAEKALFRALRTGGKPPKHGVIFQHPAIHRSPRWQRGKIARALAAKLAIAAKVDYFTGRLIGDKLTAELQQRIDEIKKLYPKPPPKVERAKVQEKKRRKGEGSGEN